MDYWIVWGYTRDRGLWAALNTREEAEERKAFWSATNPSMKIFVYHEKGLKFGDSPNRVLGIGGVA